MPLMLKVVRKLLYFLFGSYKIDNLLNLRHQINFSEQKWGIMGKSQKPQPNRYSIDSDKRLYIFWQILGQLFHKNK